MSKDPAFLFYSSDFLNGVADLTMEERGQYITLLCLNHQKGELTEKTIRLCVGSVSVDVLNKFSKNMNGNFFHARLEEEIEKRKLFTESRRNNGMKGGRPKKNSKPLGYAKHNLMEDENENKDVNNGKESVREKPKIFNFKISLIKYGFEENLVDDWLKVRKTKKATNTETSFKKFILEIEKRNCDPNKILEIIVSNSWSGFSWSWIDNLQKEKNSIQKEKEQTIGRMPISVVEKNFNTFLNAYPDGK